SSASASVTLSQAGDYKLGVEITDANGVTLDKAIEYTINNNLLINTFTIAEDPDKGYYIDKALTFDSEIEGGTPPYNWTFTVKKGRTEMDSQELTATSDTTHSFSYTPEESGTYTFNLEITDAANTTVE
ncbi:hypothetical protein, partial [Escherichia coli]|uniref:hypothetical protein n=1 Tax=Escherichia coli TaxID=562 RepID=UPI0017D59013